MYTLAFVIAFKLFLIPILYITRAGIFYMEFCFFYQYSSFGEKKKEIMGKKREEEIIDIREIKLLRVTLFFFLFVGLVKITFGFCILFCKVDQVVIESLVRRESFFFFLFRDGV